MDDRPPHLSRRSTLASLLGSAVLPFLSRPALAQSDDRPPVFETARHQFIIVRPSKILPPVSLTDINGKPATLAPTPGKILLVNIWATWCEACRVDLPLLERLQNVAGGRVNVAAVSIDKTDRQQVKRYLQKAAIRALPIYLDPEGRLANKSTDNPAPLPIYGMPLTYLVTPSGRIAGYMAGVADWLAKDGQELLAYYASA